MKIVLSILGWIFGILFILSGLTFIPDWTAVGISIGTGLILLPPVSKNLKAGIKTKTIAILAMFIVIGRSTPSNSDSEDTAVKNSSAYTIQEDPTSLNNKLNERYFNENRDQIINDTQSALDAGDFQRAVSASNRYLSAGDEELKSLNTKAKFRRDEENRTQEITALISELEGLSDSELKRNSEIYSRLSKLAPENGVYSAKATEYSEMLTTQLKAEAAAELRTKNIERQFSAWNGSHINLTQYIKQAMNDPDSYKHVETRYGDKGDHLIVKTTFRGKNAFGGVVKNSITAKVSLDGQILEIIDEL